MPIAKINADTSDIEAKNETEVRILEATRKAFNRLGYNGMTLRQIAKEVGIEVQSIYNYTPSKQALVAKVIHVGTDELHQSVRQALEDCGPRPSDRLTAAVRAHVVHYLTSPSGVAFFRDSLVHFDEDTRAQLLVLLKGYEQVFKDILTGGIASGEFRNLDVTPVTYAILGMGDSVINWYRPGGRLTAEQIGEIYGDLAVAMVAADSPRGAP